MSVVEAQAPVTASISATNPMTLTLGAAPTPGNLLLALIDISNNAPTITPPAGWTQIHTAANGTSLRVSAFYRVAQAGDGAGYTFSFSVSSTAQGLLVELSGQDTTTPIDAHNTATGASVSPVTGTATPSLSGGRAYGAMVFFGANTTFGGAPSNGYSVETGAAVARSEFLSLSDPTAATSSGDSLAASRTWAGQLVIVKAAPAGGTSFSRTGADSMALSDAGAVVGARPRSGADAVAFGDAGGGTVGRPRGGVDAIAFVDSGAAPVGRPRGGADAVVFGDSGVAPVGRPRGGMDAVAIAESGAATIGRPRAGADAVAFGDSGAAGRGLPRSGVDALAISDAGVRGVLSQGRAGVDAVAIGDAGAAWSSRLRGGADSVAFSESSVTQRGRTSTGADSVSFADSGSRAAGGHSGGADTVVIADAGGRGAGSATRSGFDVVAGLGDSGLVSRGLVRGGSDAWTISDAALVIVPSIIRGIVTGEVAGGGLSGVVASRQAGAGIAAGGSSGRAAAPLYTGP